MILRDLKQISPGTKKCSIIAEGLEGFFIIYKALEYFQRFPGSLKKITQILRNFQGF